MADRAKERSFYTLEFMLAVLERRAASEAEHVSLREGFGRMLAFDALVGAQDRHAQNWGIIEHLDDQGAPRRFAPIFDTARGLFSEYDDAALERAAERRGGRQEFIQRYAWKSKPIFGCADGAASINHFQLIEHAVTELRQKLKVPISQVISRYDARQTERDLRNEVGRVVSRLRLSYILELLKHRHQMLRQILSTRADP